MTPRSRFLALMGHELHVTEWGDPASPPVVLWHGLARTGRDFDELATRLAERWFVLCPDTIGRGLSSWSQDPDHDYTPPYYGEMALAMLDAYGIDRCAWLGTSMGALIGIQIAGRLAPARLTSLIINDIGPELPAPAVERIVTYASALPEFDSFAQAEAWFREVYIPFGPAEDAFWKRMAETSLRRTGAGKLTLHYDPKITEMLAGDPSVNVVWDIYEQITCPTHVLRGAKSDLLTEEIATRMAASGPKPGISLFPDCGHAPSLVWPADAVLVEQHLIAP